MYRVHCAQGGATYDITELVTSINWSSDIRQAAQQIDIGLLYSKDRYTPRFEPELGATVIIYEADAEIVRGIVFKVPRGHNAEMRITAWDEAVYLLRNKTTKILSGVTPTKFVHGLCSEYGITVGEIPTITMPLTRIMRDMTLADMITEVLAEATKRTGRKYQARMAAGQLGIIELGAQTATWKVALGQNLMDAEHTRSIEEMRNRIVIRGEGDVIVATAEDEALVAAYGLMSEQLSESASSDVDAQTMAAQYLSDLGRIAQTLSVTALGIATLRAGDMLTLEDETLGISGTYRIDRARHTYRSGAHTMNLELNYEEVTS